MGGGGFSMQPENLALDRYVIKQTGKKRPKVCFLPTASGDAEGYCYKFYVASTQLDCHPSHLSLFRLPTADLESFILEKDALYVGGGNTKSMLALWGAWGLDDILRKAWQRGVVLAGLSAGAICWFEQGVTDSVPGHHTALPCLGFLRGSCCPHYDGEPERRPSYHRLLTEGKIAPGLALDNDAAAHYVGDSLRRIVTSRPVAKAYVVERTKDGVSERALPGVCLT
jgi:peptidase E